MKQYIGARYVPKIMGEWNNQQVYEPFSVVLYLGSSYTSVTTVPAGTVPTNQQYWVLTGNYNAQVEEYRQDVETLKANLERKVLIIGDSYLAGYPDIGTTYGDLFGQYNGLIKNTNLFLYGVGAAGFTLTGNTFKDLCQQAVNEIGDINITDIFIIGGANDINQSASAILQGIQACNIILKQWPNAKQSVIFCAFGKTYNYSVVKSYYALCQTLGMTFYDMQVCIHNYKLITQGDVHPNQEGQNNIAYCLTSIFKQGCICWATNNSMLLLQSEHTVSANNLWWQMDNNGITLNIEFHLTASSNLPTNSWITVGTITNSVFARKFGYIHTIARVVQSSPNPDLYIPCALFINGNNELLLNIMGNNLVFNEVILFGSTHYISLDNYNN